MGCDIHLQVERREEGVWKRVPHPTRPCDDEYCTDGLYNEKTPNEKMWGQAHYRCKGTGFYTDEFWDDRNYDVFAILANVRNGYGFAGCDTGDGFVPIDEPRGLPDDLSDEVRAGIDGDQSEYGDPQWFWLGDHSHSWLLVQEILDYDWTRTTKMRGWVGVSEFETFEREGRPSSWSGGISGGMVQHISNAEMRRRIADGSATREDTMIGPLAIAAPFYYTLVEWEVPYTDAASRFLRVLHRDIVPLGDPSDVRLVFGFDS